MKISIDRDGCISCGLCAATCPEVFQLGDFGQAEVIQEPQPDQMDAVEEAASNCPVSVIEVSK